MEGRCGEKKLEEAQGNCDKQMCFMLYDVNNGKGCSLYRHKCI